jgi:DNA-binding CsgD family transcriptional regulator
MGKMTYDEFINRPNTIWRRVLHKSEEVMRIEAICTRATSVFGERVQSSFDNTKEKNYIALIEARRELYGLMEEHDIAQEEVREFLYGSLSEEEADLLEWKYIDGKNAKEIADIFCEQEQTIRNKMSRFEKKARDRFKKV